MRGAFVEHLHPCQKIRIGPPRINSAQEPGPSVCQAGASSAANIARRGLVNPRRATRVTGSRAKVAMPDAALAIYH
jgi:hypothetical protein